MTKKTKEAVKATAAIVIAVVVALVIWIYPLYESGKIVARPDADTTMPDIKTFGLEADTLSFLTEDNLRLRGMLLSAADVSGDSASGDSVKGTVILLHGLFDGMSSQLEKASALVKAGFRVIAYDQRGYGLSQGRFRSGGYFESNDLQEAVARLYLENRLVHPVIVWGEDHGAAAALRGWQENTPIDYVVAENPVMIGRDWQKRVVRHDSLSAPDIMLGIIWWWMKQKSGYEIKHQETDLNDYIGTAIVRRPDRLLVVACGNDGVPENSYIAAIADIGGNWLILPCSETTLFAGHKDAILSAVMAMIKQP